MITSKFNRRGPRGRRSVTMALAATIAGGGLAAVLAAGTASAVTAPAPAAGIAPGATVAGSTRVVGYTATGGSVWLRNLSTGALRQRLAPGRLSPEQPTGASDRSPGRPTLPGLPRVGRAPYGCYVSAHPRDREY